MTITRNLHLAFQWDTATAAIERVEFTAEDKVEEPSAEPAGSCAESMRAASPLLENITRTHDEKENDTAISISRWHWTLRLD